MMMANGKRNNVEAPAKKQELGVSREDGICRLLGGEGQLGLKGDSAELNH